VHDRAVAGPAAERQLRHAQPRRQRISRGDPRGAHPRIGRGERQPLDSLRESEVAGTVVSHELDQPRHTNWECVADFGIASTTVGNRFVGIVVIAACR
jgi:hypothetical protein